MADMRSPRPTRVDSDQTVVSHHPELEPGSEPSETNSHDRTALIRNVAALALDDDDSLPAAHVSMLDLSDLGSLPNITMMDQPTPRLQPLPPRRLPKTAANPVGGQTSASRAVVRWNDDGMDAEPTSVTEVLPAMLRAIVAAELMVISEEVSAAAKRDPALAVTLRRLRALQERFRNRD
jgi:hypothetical protein